MKYKSLSDATRFALDIIEGRDAFKCTNCAGDDGDHKCEHCQESITTARCNEFDGVCDNCFSSGEKIHDNEPAPSADDCD